MSGGVSRVYCPGFAWCRGNSELVLLISSPNLDHSVWGWGGVLVYSLFLDWVECVYICILSKVGALKEKIRC